MAEKLLKAQKAKIMSKTGAQSRFAIYSTTFTPPLRSDPLTLNSRLQKYRLTAKGRALAAKLVAKGGGK